MASFPNTADLDVLAAAMNDYARSTDEYGGQTITVAPGDVTLVSGGSLTDADGNVFTMQPMTGPFADSPLADIYENGNLLESGQTLGGGFWDVMRLVGGVVVAENGKGLGWAGPGFNGGPDPGPGDNAGTPTDTPPPVDNPPPVDTTDNPPVDNPPPVDTTPPPVDTTETPPATSPDDTVHAFFHRAHHHHDHRLGFIGKDNASSADGNTGHVSPAAIADLAAAALTDLTAVAGGSVPITNLVAAITSELSAHHSDMIDPTILAQCLSKDTTNA